MTIFLMIPLATMLFIGGVQVYSFCQDLIEARQIKLSVATSLQLDEIVHEIQKERGLTAGYTAGKNKQQKKILHKQRAQTDIKIEQFEQLSNRISDADWSQQSLSGKQSIEQNLTKIAKVFEQLKVTREAVDNINHFESFKYYSKINQKLIVLIQQVQTASGSSSHIRNSHNYIRLLRLKESAGQERGTINGVLASGQLDLRKLQQINTYAVNQEQQIQHFLVTAEPDHKQKLLAQLGSQVNHRVMDVRAWFKENLAKGNIINDIQYLLGYSGLTHSFKNYVLRGDDHYIEQFDIKANEIRMKIKVFKSQAELERADFLAIEFIKRTVSAFQNAMLKAIKLRENNATIEQIDKLVKIDDSAAIIALSRLRKDSFIIDPISWWHVSSKRISLFQQVSDRISKEMLEQANAGQQYAIVKVVFVLLLLLFTFLVSVGLASTFLKRLVSEVEAIAGAMAVMSKPLDFDQPIKVQGSDEVSQIAIAFNKMLVQRHKSEGDSLIYATVFEHASEGIMITNAQNEIEMINPAFSEISGYSRDEVVGKLPSLFQSGRHEKKFYQGLWQDLLADNSWQGEIWNKRKNGEVYPQFLTISVVKDQNNTITQHISLFSDMTKFKQYEQDIWHQANFDALTGLPNRKLCLGRLNHEIEMEQRANGHLALMFIDLDRFKYVNDTLGHKSGDELLQITAKRLSDCVRKTDTVARFGGDEFVIILPNIQNSCAIERLADSIISSLATPFILSNQHEAIVSASIGITSYPSDGTDATELLKNADTAMYQAKDDGRNTFRFFTKMMNQLVTEHMKLELELRKAIERQEFILHYQPVVSLSTGEVIGAEALIRWQHPCKGLISPDNFIGLAEETGLIEPIGKWVLQQAIADLKRWHQLGYKLHVAVNVSGRQCQQNCQPSIHDVIKDILRVNDIEPLYLKMEITESLLMDKSQQTIALLNSIRKLGVDIHMDDFGTGYSSLSYLKLFPIDVLKIDRSFISGATEDQIDARLVEAVILIGHSLNLKLVGEGIETIEHLEFVKQLGCDYGQGYYISKPLELASFIDFITRENSFHQASLLTSST
ncbi:MAG: EAL domain-containing protein [Gammaproteobacteria bacterium]|nr:EAL domain-containing protein [Gammaproteobacteria bacterium]